MGKAVPEITRIYTGYSAEVGLPLAEPFNDEREIVCPKGKEVTLPAELAETLDPQGCWALSQNEDGTYEYPAAAAARPPKEFTLEELRAACEADGIEIPGNPSKTDLAQLAKNENVEVAANTKKAIEDALAEAGVAIPKEPETVEEYEELIDRVTRERNEQDAEESGGHVNQATGDEPAAQ